MKGSSGIMKVLREADKLGTLENFVSQWVKCINGNAAHILAQMNEQQTTHVIDPISGHDVIYAPRRADRSNAFVRETLVMPEDTFCPFCVGNENETPPEVARWPADPQLPWQGRVIPNRFPIVDTDSERGYGQHEIVIESSHHDASWLSITSAELANVLLAVQNRIKHLESDVRLQCIQVFKNVGARAGASLAHPHLQIVGLGMIPAQLNGERVLSRKYREHRGCDYHQQLLQQLPDELVVNKSDDFVTLCPPVSKMPYELRILPLINTSYSNMPTTKLHELANVLQQTLRQLTAAVGSVAHNILWKLPLRGEPQESWYLEVLPRLTTMAGLEFSTGIYVNPILPTVAAANLRSSL
jgi:UDPglucose--hexose-1-phosphate uridylyltransferase